jgi:hypothetical protein
LDFFDNQQKNLTKLQRLIIKLIILGTWLSIVIFTSLHHEFWRDEVRAFTIVRDASSPLDLYSLLQNEGHPILWYLILYIVHSIIDTSLVLPITSITIAFIAVTIFMFFSPFSFWFRCFFIFSAFPIYEYSVMARNYGISMLLLFLIAILFQKRKKYPLSLAFILALLANTNVHSVILVSLIGCIWLWDIILEKRRLKFLIVLVQREME